jgi:hypothetical protein
MCSRGTNHLVKTILLDRSTTEFGDPIIKAICDLVRSNELVKPLHPEQGILENEHSVAGMV